MQQHGFSVCLTKLLIITTLVMLCVFLWVKLLATGNSCFCNLFSDTKEAEETEKIIMKSVAYIATYIIVCFIPA